MKAAIRDTYGSPAEISVKKITRPKPGSKEVLVEVRATTVNRTDCANLTAKPFIMRFILGLFKPRQKTLGTDFSGIVVGVGKEVKTCKPGDRVFGFYDLGLGSQAEYLCTSEDNVFPIPDNIDFKSAAASLEGAHYAYTFVTKSNITSGKSVLINGGSGAIGSALIQFVRQFDVSITATCSTKNTELIRSLGADRVIDYTQVDFTKTDEKYDFVFDSVGKSTFGRCKPILKPKGIYISSELGPYCQNVFFTLTTLRAKGRKVFFPIPYDKKITIPYISDRLQSGVFHPVIDREYDLDEVQEAYTYVLSGEKTGNVLLCIKGNGDD